MVEIKVVEMNATLNLQRGNEHSQKLTFDQQEFAEAKAYKKPGKIYCCSTFRGRRDSIIKRLV